MLGTTCLYILRSPRRAAGRRSAEATPPSATVGADPPRRRRRGRGGRGAGIREYVTGGKSRGAASSSAQAPPERCPVGSAWSRSASPPLLPWRALRAGREVPPRFSRAAYDMVPSLPYAGPLHAQTASVHDHAWPPGPCVVHASS